MSSVRDFFDRKYVLRVRGREHEGGKVKSSKQRESEAGKWECIFACFSQQEPVCLVFVYFAWFLQRIDEAALATHFHTVYMDDLLTSSLWQVHCSEKYRYNFTWNGSRPTCKNVSRTPWHHPIFFTSIVSLSLTFFFLFLFISEIWFISVVSQRQSLMTRVLFCN